MQQRERREGKREGKGRGREKREGEEEKGEEGGGGEDLDRFPTPPTHHLSSRIFHQINPLEFLRRGLRDLGQRSAVTLGRLLGRDDVVGGKKPSWRML